MKKNMNETVPTWMWAVWAVLTLIIFCLVFIHYFTRCSINDCVMVLIKQIWAMQRYATSNEKSWGADVLTVPGVKGDLLIRRHTLMLDWMAQFEGKYTPALQQISDRIQSIDKQLSAYGLKLTSITALTQKMVEHLYHGNQVEALNVTDNILARIRNI
jgi:hypothetical protein